MSRSSSNRKWWAEQASDHRNLTAHHCASSVPGTQTVEATINFMPNPIGILWYHWTGVRSVEILNCYVPASYRRCGVMTFLLKKLLADNRHIRVVTTSGATTEGRAWMRQMGFRLDDPDGDWVLTVKARKAK